MNRVLSLPAVEQAKLIRERKISSEELVTAHLGHIESINPSLNAAVEVFADTALTAARNADRSPSAGIFHGVPFSIKDSIEVKDYPCTAGTVGRKRVGASDEDAALVARLRGAGAIPLAHTNLPDLLFAFESDNLIFGRTNNPYDLTRTSGGSSGGEAALIAACGSPMGLGSDAAGSVRLPAAFCGIAGLKPTSGRLCRDGHYPPAGGWIECLWQIGPMARSVRDLIAMMSVLATDGDQPFVPAQPGKLRIVFHDAAAPEVAATVRRAAEALASDRNRVTEARPACLDEAYELEMKFLGADGGDAVWHYLNEIGSSEVHPLLRAWLDKLRPYRTDIKGFQQYWEELDSFRSAMAGFLRGNDVFLCPAYEHPALLHGASIEDSNFRGFHHTMAFNLTGWPAAVVRCGTSSTGLPIAVQIAARPFREDLVLAVALRLEELLGGWRPPDLILK